ncbi:hypothetical protein B6V72_14605 [Thioclava sp. F34-6]|uniref:BRO-N domain-containing protein n=1 Tax=Thioclava sp. F34-6 TaxID=1973003 RepID=UPI000B5427C2|nr:Bro-N domain-containing protein [Thioclava sp. F34-6]OWY12323.1 hypothetical protein B6V72_14605 [Thioclava sp. F34-6]
MTHCIGRLAPACSKEVGRSQALKPFDFNGSNIRVIDMDGEPWFPAKDVCDVLGYTNSRRAVSAHVDHRDTQLIKRSNVTGRYVETFPTRGMTCVNESGLYTLILGSKLASARDFKRWVTSVVLPAIRKECGYVMDEKKVTSGEMSENELPAQRRD